MSDRSPASSWMPESRIISTCALVFALPAPLPSMPASWYGTARPVRAPACTAVVVSSPWRMTGRSSKMRDTASMPAIRAICSALNATSALIVPGTTEVTFAPVFAISEATICSFSPGKSRISRLRTSELAFSGFGCGTRPISGLILNAGWYGSTAITPTWLCTAA